MTAPPVIAVFGISGVGKSTLVAHAVRRMPGTLHLQASALIKEGLADPAMASEALRLAGSDRIAANQELLVEVFARRAAGGGVIFFDGHLVIDTDGGSSVVAVSVIERLRPRIMVHVEEDTAVIARRRQGDRERQRPSRTPEILVGHQQLSHDLCAGYAVQLSVPMRVLRVEDVDRLVDLAASISAHR